MIRIKCYFYVFFLFAHATHLSLGKLIIAYSFLVLLISLFALICNAGCNKLKGQEDNWRGPLCSKVNKHFQLYVLCSLKPFYA